MSERIRCLTVGHVAERLKVSIATIWRWQVEGFLPNPGEAGATRRPLAGSGR